MMMKDTKNHLFLRHCRGDWMPANDFAKISIALDPRSEGLQDLFAWIRPDRICTSWSIFMGELTGVTNLNMLVDPVAYVAK